tara:strand:+ start:216 stop:416 length:201 start_codon:yes stop_codon:yes gene_type:complete
MSITILTGFIMASKFTITPAKSKTPREPMHYEKVSEHRQEMSRIKAVEKELKQHEAQGLDKAHKGK